MSMPYKPYFYLYLLLGMLTPCYSEPKYYLYDFQMRMDRLQPIGKHGEVVIPLWNYGKHMKVLIHGWNIFLHLDGSEVIEKQAINIVARELARSNPNQNIVIVDWTFWGTTRITQYFEAVEGTRKAGIYIANFLLVLKMSGIISDWSKVHIVGHSLGSHIAGVIGHEIQRRRKGAKIGRITGLDPAGPGFTKRDGTWPNDKTKILDYSDAAFVDIIHTSMGNGRLTDIALNGDYGSNLQAGHADFYPNGGNQQTPQCNFFTDRFAACSHVMSVRYYALSIKKPEEFLACPCDSYSDFRHGLCTCEYPNGTAQPMGEWLSPTARGKYFFKIKSILPLEKFDKD